LAQEAQAQHQTVAVQLAVLLQHLLQLHPMVAVAVGRLVVVVLQVQQEATGDPVEVEMELKLRILRNMQERGDSVIHRLNHQQEEMGHQQ
jgi:hypothetical protein